MTEHAGPSALARPLLTLRYTPAEVAERARRIYDDLLRTSPRVRTGNFTAIASADLSLLFDRYDDDFFKRTLRQLLDAGGTPLTLQLSRRMTRAAGLTKRFSPRAGRGVTTAATRYEIAISTTLLFQTFQDVQRPIRVSGLECRDRLEALQRIFEHELVHLVEMLLWGRSSCAGEGFRTLAGNYFAHTETRHDLVTQHERACTQFNLHVGDRVVFEHEGVRHEGLLNRITRRATVLVESPHGQPYRDGKRYQKFYVPLPLLSKVPDDPNRGPPLNDGSAAPP
jgi:hypothetical protein